MKHLRNSEPGFKKVLRTKRPNSNKFVRLWRCSSEPQNQAIGAHASVGSSMINQATCILRSDFRISVLPWLVPLVLGLQRIFPLAAFYHSIMLGPPLQIILELRNMSTWIALAHSQFSFSPIMNVCCLVSGGKDSTYAAWLATQHGHKLVALANLFQVAKMLLRVTSSGWRKWARFLDVPDCGYGCGDRVFRVYGIAFVPSAHSKRVEGRWV